MLSEGLRQKLLFSFDGDGFGEVAGSVDLTLFLARDVVGEKLERRRDQERIGEGCGIVGGAEDGF